MSLFWYVVAESSPVWFLCSGCPVFPLQFIEKAVFPPLCILALFGSQSIWPYKHGFISGLSTVPLVKNSNQKRLVSWWASRRRRQCIMFLLRGHIILLGLCSSHQYFISVNVHEFDKIWDIFLFMNVSKLNRGKDFLRKWYQTNRTKQSNLQVYLKVVSKNVKSVSC